ncbi:methyltransferase domain-containing protein [uncultured Shewanella sp.]|uniref:methyltransferase domain-containing protein n=1 Tax=Shewanella atlantica TaxID=271099 RepID=UPI002609A614|nr:methyltransferase domain-containing protein [uncultured Shewanella sp.]
MKSIYLCPVCDQPLLIHEASGGLHCCKKHHFDKNANGYWTFSQAKKPQTDSRQVMRAKRFLLESGIFMPVIEKLEAMLIAAELSDGEIHYLDYDCGEGYYLRELRAKLAQSHYGRNIAKRLCAYGITEAENALFSAAKIQSEAKAAVDSGETDIGCDKKQDTTFIVSTLKKLPLADDSLDLVTLIDKQLKGKELLRVLKPGGVLIQVSPAPRHLWQLREFIYPDMQEKSLNIPQSKALELLQTERVSFKLALNGEQAIALLEMTPYAWRANDKVRKQIAAASFEALEIDFVITVSKKR